MRRAAAAWMAAVRTIGSGELSLSATSDVAWYIERLTDQAYGFGEDRTVPRARPARSSSRAPPPFFAPAGPDREGLEGDWPVVCERSTIILARSSAPLCRGL